MRQAVPTCDRRVRVCDRRCWCPQETCSRPRLASAATERRACVSVRHGGGPSAPALTGTPGPSACPRDRRRRRERRRRWCRAREQGRLAGDGIAGPSPWRQPRGSRTARHGVARRGLAAAGAGAGAESEREEQPGPAVSVAKESESAAASLQQPGARRSRGRVGSASAARPGPGQPRCRRAGERSVPLPAVLPGGMCSPRAGARGAPSLGLGPRQHGPAELYRHRSSLETPYAAHGRGVPHPCSPSTGGRTP